jgi:hypothetical protein
MSVNVIGTSVWGVGLGTEVTSDTGSSVGGAVKTLFIVTGGSSGTLLTRHPDNSKVNASADIAHTATVLIITDMNLRRIFHSFPSYRCRLC